MPNKEIVYTLQVEWHVGLDGMLTRIKNMPTKAPMSPPPNAVIINFNISRGFLGAATVTPPLQNHPYNVRLHSYITKAFEGMPLCSYTQTSHHPLSSTVILGPLLCRHNVKEANQNALQLHFCTAFRYSPFHTGPQVQPSGLWSSYSQSGFINWLRGKSSRNLRICETEGTFIVNKRQF